MKTRAREEEKRCPPLTLTVGVLVAAERVVVGVVLVEARVVVVTELTAEVEAALDSAELSEEALRVAEDERVVPVAEVVG